MDTKQIGFCLSGEFTLRLITRSDEDEPLIEFWMGNHFVSRYHQSIVVAAADLGEGILLQGGDYYGDGEIGIELEDLERGLHRLGVCNYGGVYG